jgi:Saxitoxin biosynthesis operon protein SxtJ
MTWSDIPLRPAGRALRQFAAGWLVCFSALGAQQYWVRHHAGLGVALMSLAVAIGVAGLLKPALVRWVFVSWMVLAFPIGWAISQLMLLLMYYLILTPVAVVFRMRGRDLLRRRRPAEAASLWSPKATPSDVRSYLRQY